MAARMVFFKLRSLFTDVEYFLVRLLAPHNGPYHRGPALALDVQPNAEPNMARDALERTKSTLAQLFDGFLWGAVPKNRRSRERRAIRQFGSHKIRDYMTPKQNLIECLDCGTFHEAHTICGKCYQKVREETQAMQARMDPDKRLFDVPQTEVVYVYEGDEDTRKMSNGKFIVEMDKPRPEWFPKNLLTKGHGKY